MADAHRHKQVIETWLETKPNTVILSDRGYYSHLIYQQATFKEGLVDADELKRLSKLVDWYVYKPQYTLILDVDFEVACGRMNTRGEKDVIELLGPSFLKHVNNEYKEVRTGHKLFKVNGNPDVDTVFSDVQYYLMKIVNKLRHG
jgi:thymidylate kinase